jgi:hypothetical protein
MQAIFLTGAQVQRLRSLAERLAATGLEEECAELRGVLATADNPRQHVGASEAAEILGVTAQTVRNWVRGGILPGGCDVTGHFFVEAAALEHAIRIAAALPDDVGPPIPDELIDAEIAAVRAERRARSMKH